MYLVTYENRPTIRSKNTGGQFIPASQYSHAEAWKCDWKWQFEPGVAPENFAKQLLKAEP